MIKHNVSHTLETSSAKWKPSKVSGVEYISLNADPDDRYGTFLLRMAPNTTYPKHRHPEGEEILLLKGEMTVGPRTMKSGDFLYSPPGSIHSASTRTGCVFLSILPKPIDIISDTREGDLETELQQEVQPTSGGPTPTYGEVDLEVDVPSPPLTPPSEK